MSKYVIKNCPACRQYNVFGVDDKPCCYSYMKYCQDCTDCVMKQIVDYCLDNEEYGDEYYTRPILEKLDIQEVE